MSTSGTLLTTPLYSNHCQAGARLVEFGGWSLPVQFSGVLEEHKAVRAAVGLFDLCHMGHLNVSGRGALQFVQKVTTNDAARLAVGQAQYSLLCDHRGGVIDDILVYHLEQSYLLVVNAANVHADFDWLLQQCDGEAQVENISADVGMLSIQGPLSRPSLQSLISVDISPLRRYRSMMTKLAGVDTLLSRTGYTGEDGFELVCPRALIQHLWQSLLEASPSPTPCGLGARDTLRLEAGMPLYGHELTREVTPFEARLECVVQLRKPDFIGKSALQAIERDGVRRRLVRLEVNDRALARNGFAIRSGEEVIGVITSGGYSATSGKSIAMGYVATQFAADGVEVNVLIRERRIPALVVRSLLSSGTATRCV